MFSHSSLLSISFFVFLTLFPSSWELNVLELRWDLQTWNALATSNLCVLPEGPRGTSIWCMFAVVQREAWLLDGLDLRVRMMKFAVWLQRRRGLGEERFKLQEEKLASAVFFPRKIVVSYQSRSRADAKTPEIVQCQLLLPFSNHKNATMCAHFHTLRHFLFTLPCG